MQCKLAAVAENAEVPPLLLEDASPTVSQIGLSEEALREFLIESYDNLEQVERDLLMLERDPKSEPVLNSVFRNIHTIKGSAGFLAYSTLERVAHATENVLGSVRSSQIPMDNDVSESMFKSVDAIRKILKSIETEGNDGSDPFTSLICDIENLHTNKLIDARAACAKGVTKRAALTPVATPLVAKAASVSTIAPVAVESTPASISSATTQRSSAAAANQVKSNAGGASSSASTNDSSAADSTIRVDVALLDKLMTRVGELVLARNQILQFNSTINDNALHGATQRLNLITTELQEGVMKTRMQPIGTVWSKFPRLVRDLAAICEKEVRIEMEGKETELDKTIIEAIKDPLTHLVRNTVDHGIERPEIRAEKGKSSEGCLTLRAYHEGGQVNIEICDDGAGLNLVQYRGEILPLIRLSDTLGVESRSVPGQLNGCRRLYRRRSECWTGRRSDRRHR